MINELEIQDAKVIEGDKALLIAQGWLSIFCKHRTSFKDIRGGKTYLWDEIHSKFQNEEALEQYSLHQASSYFIITDNFGEFEKRVFVSRTKPKGNPNLADFHVFPKNLAWSMAFTHEDGWIGPKFFTHSNYQKLNKENEKDILAISKIRV